MKRPQFSILGLLGLVAYVAVACTSLINANDYWVAGLFTVATATLSLAILLSVFRRGSSQAFWLGFAIVGWLYWIGLQWDQNRMMQPRDGIHTDFVTSWVLNWTYETVLPKVRTPPPPPTGGGFFGAGSVVGFAGGGTVVVAPAVVGGGAVTNTYPDRYTFLRVGQPLWTLLLAFLGGRVAVYLDAARRERPSVNA